MPIGIQNRSPGSLGSGCAGGKFFELPGWGLCSRLEMRKVVAKIIRREQPDVLVTCHPKTLYVGDSRINHPEFIAPLVRLFWMQYFQPLETLYISRSY